MQDLSSRQGFDYSNQHEFVLFVCIFFCENWASIVNTIGVYNIGRGSNEDPYNEDFENKKILLQP